MIQQNFEISDSIVTLRKLKISDKDHVIDLLSDPDVMTYIGPRRSMNEDEIDDWLINNIKRYDIEWNRWAVALKTNDEFIGMAGVQLIEQKFDFGYYFRKSFWGKGLTKSSIELAIRSIRSVGIKSEAFIANKNIRSIRIAEKAGLTEYSYAIRYGEKGRCYRI